MKPLIIFGTSEIAQLAYYYFTSEARREVVAFTVDREFLDKPHFEGLPLVPFDEISRRFPAPTFEAFVALSYAQVNQVRRDKFLALKELGYSLASFRSEHGYCADNVEIGENCFILEDVVLQPYVRIGNNVTVWSGSHVGHHSVVGDHCFLAPRSALSGGVILGERCFIGVNATIRDHISIGARCIIGAGAVMLSDAASDGVYRGGEAVRAVTPSSEIRKI